MMRIVFLAIAFICCAGLASAENAKDDAVKSLKEFQAFSIERAQLAVKLREVVAFERFYEQKKEKLGPEFKRLEEEKLALMGEKSRVEAACQPPKARGKAPAAAAAARCQSRSEEFDLRVAQYTRDYKSAYGEIASLDKAEKDRKVNEEETARLLDEATKLLAALEKMVPASKQKECIIACNAKPPLEIEQCLQGCMEAE
jgi:hypothetical protein